MNIIEETIGYLGRRARDKITGAEGIITSVSFDLYGCIQVGLNRGLDKDGKQHETYWYDIQRFELNEDQNLVMPIPDFASRPEVHRAKTYTRGPAEKASPR